MTLPLCWVCIVESCYDMTALDYSRALDYNCCLRNETNRNCIPIGTVMAKGQMFLPNNFMISRSPKDNSWERRSFRVLRAQSRCKVHTCFDSFNDIGENWILKINFLRIKQGKDAPQKYLQCLVMTLNCSEITSDLEDKFDYKKYCNCQYNTDQYFFNTVRSQSIS